MRRKTTAFTLIELLIVIFIMVLIMSASVVSYFKMRSTGEMRGAANRIKAGLALARQRAVMMREVVRVNFVADAIINQVANSCFYITSDVGWFGETNFLPAGVRITSPNQTITFYPSGNSRMAGTQTIVINHRTTPQTVTIMVYNLTGLVDIQ